MIESSAPDGIEVRRLRSNEAEPFRELRFAALKDSPDAFGSTLETEEGYPPERWETWTRDASSDETGIWVAVAHGDGRLVGMIGLFPDPVFDDALHVWGMWVDPDHRGRQIGAALIDAALAGAARTAARQVRLHVVETNRAAAHLYAAFGFEPDGEPEPFPSNPALTQIELKKDLGR